MENCIERSYDEANARVNTRLTGYRAMVDLADKYMRYLKYEKDFSTIKREKKFKTMRDFKKESSKLVQEFETKLGRNVMDYFFDLKSMQREYANMPINRILQSMNYRVNLSRHKRDILVYNLKQYSEKYQQKLLDLACLEDIVNFEGSQLPDLKDINRCQCELKNSETRIRVLRTLQSTYKTIINVLDKDKIWYDRSLRGLEKDIQEQSGFIDKAIEIGKPAIRNLDTLEADYRNTMIKFRQEIELISSRLISIKGKLKEKREELNNLVNFENKLELPKYVRYSESMIRMTRELENLEHSMTLLRSFRDCPKENTENSQQIQTGQQLSKIVRRKHKFHRALENFTTRGKFTLMTLKEGVIAPEEFRKRIELIMELDGKIQAAKRNQLDISKHIKNQGKIYVYLRLCLYQLADQLRNVGDPIGKVRKFYPDPNLKLPLLKFSGRRLKSVPPPAFEEDLTKLLSYIKERVKKLLPNWSRLYLKGELRVARDECHDGYMDSLKLETVSEKFATPIIDIFEKEYVEAVPTRKDIKSISAKIILEHTKEDYI